MALNVTTPLWGKCEITTHTPEHGTWESSGTPKNLELDYRGQNTLHWGVLYTVGKVSKCRCQNGLAWAIWTFAAQVIGERTAGSQTGSLTLGH